MSLEISKRLKLECNMLSTENRLLKMTSSIKPIVSANSLLTNRKPVITNIESTKVKIDAIEEKNQKKSQSQSLHADFENLMFHDSSSLDSEHNKEFIPPISSCINKRTVVEFTKNHEVHLESLKENLLISVACTLLPSLSIKNATRRQRLIQILDEIANIDPEFILKTALYCRQELNIRSTANFLLAYSAFNLSTRSFLGKYFAATINLPSDWIEVCEHYKTFHIKNSKNSALPNCLRKALKKKFAEFDKYQLAKYNKTPRKKKDNQLSKKNADDTSDTEDDHAITIKSLIHQLHISEPRENVLCLLRKRYPQFSTEFVRSGLPGEWDPDLAGQKMKLPVPYTWETELSKTRIQDQKKVWEQLIDSGKLPYMALLRNLRNLLLVDISLEHSKKALKQLTNTNAVASSKQMPFRFSSAFSSLDKLKTDKFRPVKELNRHAGSRKNKSNSKHFVRERRIKKVNLDHIHLYTKAVETAFEISVRRNLPVVPGSTLLIINLNSENATSGQAYGHLANNPESLKLLIGYMCMTTCEHYDAYIAISDQLFRVMDFEELFPGKGDLLKSVDTISKLFQSSNITGKFKKLSPVHDEAKPLPVNPTLDTILSKKEKFSTFLVVGDLDKNYVNFAKQYRTHVGSLKCVVNKHELAKSTDEDEWIVLPGFSDQILRFIAEFGNRALVKHVEGIEFRFNISSDLSLQRRPVIFASPSCRFSVDLPEIQKNSVRVFVSSTFLDMCGERDIISGLVFPALRKCLAKLDNPVNLNEIDLRWGVPESVTKTPDALRICLENVATSDYLILVLGERYGWSPEKEMVDALPRKLLQRVSKLYTPGMSVTEMEANLFLDLNQNKKKNLMCFLRNPESLKDLPDNLKHTFIEMNPQKCERLQNLKTLMRSQGLVQLNNYSASYSGVISKIPIMGNLAELGEAIFTALLNDISGNFKENAAETENQASDTLSVNYLQSIAVAVSPRHLREVVSALYLELPSRGIQVHAARVKASQSVLGSHESSTDLMSASAKKRKRSHIFVSDGGILCLVGSRGSGKTTLMSALSLVLSNPKWTPPVTDTSSFGSTKSSSVLDSKICEKSCRLFFHLVLGAYTSAGSFSGLVLAIPQMTQLKKMLCVWITRILNELNSDSAPVLQKELKTINAISFREGANTADLNVIIQTFHKLLKLIGLYVYDDFVFVVDSVDHLQPQSLEWIPEIIPQNVKFVFSLDGASTFAENLPARPDVLFLRMSELSSTEKAAAIRCYFAQYGKVLRETGLKNQLNKLCMKRDAKLPLYLKMACDELRLYSTVETIDIDLSKLPDRLNDLVAHIIARAALVCGENLVKTALACILCARRPLHTSQLQRMIDMWLGAEEEKRISFFFIPLQIAPISGVMPTYLIGRKEASNLVAKPKLTTLALHMLLAQLNPLLAGFELIDDRNIDTANEDGNNPQEISVLFRVQEGRLRFCSPDVADVVRKVCFEDASGSFKPLSRLSSTQRMGYIKPSFGRYTKMFAKETPPELRKTPNELQVYMLLLIEFASDINDKIFYAFHAGQMYFIKENLSDFQYLQARALKGELNSLAEEFLGFKTKSELITKAWEEHILNLDDKHFKTCRDYVLKCSDMLSKFPQLTSELIVENCSGDGMFDAKYDDSMKSPHTVIRFSRGCQNMYQTPRVVFKLENCSGSTSVTSLAVSNDGELLACGSENGSISLIDSFSGKELHTFYGHTSSVLGLVFLESESSSKMLNLYSVSTDTTSCLWKILKATRNEKSSVSGLRLATITGRHSRAITSCAWNPHLRQLVTAGLDGVVNLFSITTSLEIVNETQTSLFNVESFRKPSLTFNTQDQPINAMVIVEENIVVGCWNGSLWVFNSKSPKNIRAQIYSSMIEKTHTFKGPRDKEYYEKWSPRIGTHSAIISLTYSGSKRGLLASLDFSGEVLLIDALTMLCISRLVSPNPFSTELSGSLSFFNPSENPDKSYLAHVGSRFTTSGSIHLWSVSEPVILGNQINKEDLPSPQCVSAATVLPFTLTALLGCENGHLLAVNNEPRKCMTLSEGGTGKIQAIDTCVLLSYKHQLSASVLFVTGTSSGAVNFGLFSMRLPNESTSLLEYERLERAVLHDSRSNSSAWTTLWSHSVSNQSTGGGKAGGTLCVAASSGIVASGGGDSTCWFYFFNRYSICANGWKCDRSVCTTEHSAGVSAISVVDSFAVSGGKDGKLTFYKLNPLEEPISKAITEPHAHMDWITSVAISDQRGKDKHKIDYVVASGGNDHRVVVWKIDDEFTVKRLHVLMDHMSSVTRLIFSNNTLASCSSDGDLIIRHVTPTAANCLRRLIIDEVASGTSSLSTLTFLHSATDILEENNLDTGLVRSSSYSSVCSINLFDSSASSDIETEKVDVIVPIFTDSLKSIEAMIKRSSCMPTVIEAFSEDEINRRSDLKLVIGTTDTNVSTDFSVRLVAPFKAKSEKSLLGNVNASALGLKLAPIRSKHAGVSLVSAAGCKFGDCGDVRLWDCCQSSSSSFPKNSDLVHSLAITSIVGPNPQNTCMFSSSDDGSIMLWILGGNTRNDVWTPCVKMLLYDPTSISDPVFPITAIDWNLTEDASLAILYALTGRDLIAIVISFAAVKSLSLGRTFTLPELTKIFEVRKITLPSAGFSISCFAAPMPDKIFPDVVVTNSSGSCFYVKLEPDVDVIQSLMSPNLSSCCSLAPYPNGFISMHSQSIVLLDSECKFVKSVMLPESFSSISFFRLIYMRKQDFPLILVAGKKISKDRERSCICLIKMNGIELSRYTLPDGVEITAIDTATQPQNRDDYTDNLVIVGSSDGLVRYLTFNLNNLKNQPQLLGYLPTGREITSINSVSNSQFSVGYGNGDIGVYYFGPNFNSN